jgi:Hemerythrin HHE cation binding domain
MTIITNPAITNPRTTFATVDLYRDIHKGIRAELFAITTTAGSIDPGSRIDRAALADHIVSVAAVLESHAHHEDVVIDPVLAVHLPELAEEITMDHERLETSFGEIVELACSAVDGSGTELRHQAQSLYLDLASFASAYLAHQDLEERAVMAELERRIGVEQVLELHGAIVGSIPPDEMAHSLSFMLPAMNTDDRVEMLGGMRMAAPPEAFAAVVSLARSVLQPADYSALADRLGIA